MTDAVEAARVLVLDASRSFGGPNRGPSGRDSEKRTIAALDALEAAIRADERSKVAAPTEALRVAARGVLRSIDRYGEHTIACQLEDEDEPCSCGFAFINEAYDALLAVLDGAPYEPSDADVERAAEAYYHATWGPMPSWVNAGEYDKEVARRGARAALKAAWG